MTQEEMVRHRLFMWFMLTCGLIWLMIMLGGATRLTESGLSIVEWRPLAGILPPLTEIQWLLEFQKYQNSPEYQKVTYGMLMSDFKFIYWMEYAHRLFGRLIALFFLIPVMYYGFRYSRVWKSLKNFTYSVIGLFAAQGAMGWYMVKSGLVQNPAVSPYRLTAHLVLAIVLLTVVFWRALHLRLQRTPLEVSESTRQKLKYLTWGTLLCVSLTIIYGGLVAGLKAGKIYNTYPLMAGQWVPDEWLFYQPMWINFLENEATVQWVHRILAHLSLLLSAYLTALLYKASVKRLAWGLMGGALLQVGLGIATILHHVPVGLGTAHQGGGVVLYMILLVIIHKISYKNSAKENYF